MSNSQPKKTEDSRQSQQLLRRKPSTSTAKKRREKRVYERLRGMVPQLSSKTDLTKADIVEEAAEHIEQLQKRVWSRVSTPEHTAKARDFLLQRISQDFKLCRRSVRNESNPGSNPEPRFHLPSSEVRDTDPMEGELSAVNRQRDCNTRPPV